MKEKIRQKLLKSREEFLKLENYNEYNCFNVFVYVVPNEEKLSIVLIPAAFKNFEKEEFKEKDSIVYFSDLEIVGDYNKEREEFEELVEYCSRRYFGQFSFSTSYFIDGLYGKVMDKDKLLYIIEDCIRNEQLHLLDGGIGFVISETIF